mmetsp:Transcript_18583/g.34875  ORF Transcript_18583/g.34875 Transcript_18583/m.34875 type:complete len:247 (-) Transcript_18583:200-940(-)
MDGKEVPRAPTAHLQRRVGYPPSWQAAHPTGLATCVARHRSSGTWSCQARSDRSGSTSSRPERSTWANGWGQNGTATERRFGPMAPATRGAGATIWPVERACSNMRAGPSTTAIGGITKPTAWECTVVPTANPTPVSGPQISQTALVRRNGLTSRAIWVPISRGKNTARANTSGRIVLWLWANGKTTRSTARQAGKALLVSGTTVAGSARRSTELADTSWRMAKSTPGITWTVRRMALASFCGRMA